MTFRTPARLAVHRKMTFHTSGRLAVHRKMIFHPTARLAVHRKMTADRPTAPASPSPTAPAQSPPRADRHHTELRKMDDVKIINQCFSLRHPRRITEQIIKTRGQREA
jgi:hypothetical protein